MIPYGRSTRKMPNFGKPSQSEDISKTVLYRLGRLEGDVQTLERDLGTLQAKLKDKGDEIDKIQDIITKTHGSITSNTQQVTKIRQDIKGIRDILDEQKETKKGLLRRGVDVAQALIITLLVAILGFTAWNTWKAAIRQAEAENHQRYHLPSPHPPSTQKNN